MAEKYMGMEKYIFTDTYNLFLKFKNMPDTEEHWKIVQADANMLVSKYKGNYLAQEMVLTVLEQLQHKICGNQLNGKTYKQWEKELGIYSN